MNSCHHKSNLSTPLILSYCLATSSLFVASLYIFVPPSVRKLPRDDPRHIQWRSGATIAVVILCTSAYPWLFCRDTEDEEETFPPFHAYLGIVTWRSSSPVESIARDVKILLHVVVLYLGSFACTWTRIYHRARLLQQKETGLSTTTNDANASLPLFPKPHYIHKSVQRQWMIHPSLVSINNNNTTIRWITLRNLLIAPIVEEIMFRSLLLPPLLCTDYSTARTRCHILAPLFFGIAHFHHFYTKRIEYNNLLDHYKQLLPGLALQWGYTTVFGVYVSRVFVMTGSLYGVVAVHSFCNYMGLPEMEFLQRQRGGEKTELYRYRWMIGWMYGVGMWLFWIGLKDDSGFLFPTDPVLPALLGVV